MTNDDLDELSPPTAERVARRALVLVSVVARTNIERDAEEEWAADAVEAAREILRLVRDEAEDDEAELVEARLGSLSERQVVNGTWRAEGLAVLGWALRRFELPPFDRQVDVTALTDSLGFSDGEGAGELLDSPVLRPHREIVKVADRLFAVHWRLREFELEGTRIDFADVAQNVWFGRLPIDNVPLANGDLALDAVPISEASEEVVRETHSIVMERRVALEWLLGADELYSEVTTDT